MNIIKIHNEIIQKGGETSQITDDKAFPENMANGQVKSTAPQDSNITVGEIELKQFTDNALNDAKLYQQLQAYIIKVDSGSSNYDLITKTRHFDY